MEQAALFNRKNSTYHVVIEDCGSGNDAEDFESIDMGSRLENREL